MSTNKPLLCCVVSEKQCWLHCEPMINLRQLCCARPILASLGKPLVKYWHHSANLLSTVVCRKRTCLNFSAGFLQITAGWRAVRYFAKSKLVAVRVNCYAHFCWIDLCWRCVWPHFCYMLSLFWLAWCRTASPKQGTYKWGFDSLCVCNAKLKQCKWEAAGLKLCGCVPDKHLSLFPNAGARTL